MKTLILDLDQTLVHYVGTKKPGLGKANFLPIFLPVSPSSVNQKLVLRLKHPILTRPLIQNGKKSYFMIRPGLSSFLREISQLYRIVIFTAASQAYADEVLDLLDPFKDYFTTRFYRDSVTFIKGDCYKDLRKVVDQKELSQTVFVDDLPVNTFQILNQIQIEAFLGEAEDSELDILATFLVDHVKDAADVRPVLRMWPKFRNREIAHQKQQQECPSIITNLLYPILRANSNGRKGGSKVMHGVWG